MNPTVDMTGNSPALGARARVPRSHGPTVPRSHPRGISLTEVLISMGVLAFGLLGVAAMLPVGGHYMQTGDEANRGAAVARAAFAELITRGMLNPDVWMQHSGGTPSFTGQFRKENRELQVALPLAESRVQTFGSVYVIDPLGVARALQSNALPGPLSRFPAVQDNRPNFYQATQQLSASWMPWTSTWGVRRLSVAAPNSGRGDYGNVIGVPIPLSLDLASNVFTSGDDLAVSVPTRDDEPSRQLWDAPDTNGDNIPDLVFNRSTTGDYSWLVTVAPSTSEARDALATDPSAYYYNVSVVVFHKRVFDFATDSQSTSNEKLLRARVVSQSLTGGELILEPVENDPASDLFSEVRPGLWIMLCGPGPTSSRESPVLFARWYRVLAVEGKEDGGERISREFNLPTGPRRLVALRGTSWPWQPGAPNELSDNDRLSNDLRVAIVPGAVAVHSRNMRLEGPSAWSVE